MSFDISSMATTSVFSLKCNNMSSFLHVRNSFVVVCLPAPSSMVHISFGIFSLLQFDIFRAEVK